MVLSILACSLAFLACGHPHDLHHDKPETEQEHQLDGPTWGRHRVCRVPASAKIAVILFKFIYSNKVSRTKGMRKFGRYSAHIPGLS
jgi:hypothetical protein